MFICEQLLWNCVQLNSLVRQSTGVGNPTTGGQNMKRSLYKIWCHKVLNCTPSPPPLFWKVCSSRSNSDITDDGTQWNNYTGTYTILHFLLLIGDSLTKIYHMNIKIISGFTWLKIRKIFLFFNCQLNKIYSNAKLTC